MCCYIYAQKSEMEKSSTMKMTDPPGDALQNQQLPCRYTPSQLHPSVWPKDQRNTKAAPGTHATSCPLSSLLLLYSLWTEPPPYSYFVSPFARVLPELTRLQSPQPVAGPHLSTNLKTIVYSINIRPPVFYCFDNTQATVHDHLSNTHCCRTCNTLMEPSFRIL